jgi:hypothetical protein
MAAKVSKKSVNYSRATMSGRRCGLCRFYVRGRRCEKVRGDIDPQFWCILFQKAVK